MPATSGEMNKIVALTQNIRGCAIRQHLVWARTQYARAEAIKHFLGAKAASDFYFEEILNTFIALVQYPVNFALFKERPNGVVEPVKHFCSDKKHESAFSKIIRDLKPDITRDEAQNVFHLFPELLDAPRYFLAVYLMETKVGEPCLIPAFSSIFARSGKSIEASSEDELVIAAPELYIASCADCFFQLQWDVFSTDFALPARNYLMESLGRLEGDNADWASRQVQLSGELEGVTTPQGREGADKWKEELEAKFADVLFNTLSGIDMVTRMMRSRSSIDRKNVTEMHSDPPKNMFVAFRVFSREANEYRHATDDKRDGYLYDTAFLVPHTMENNFINRLNKIRADYRVARHKACNDFSTHYEFSNGKRRRRLFRNVGEGYGGVNSKNALLIIDEKFWQLLDRKEGDGPTECLKILSSWVGSQSRSLADPVYHTGLIHTNYLFQNGGLDRLGELERNGIEDWEKLSPELKQDALRAAIFYYILCETLDWAPEGEDFEPGRLAAILVPIKMRGAVWGVTIHGAYTPEPTSIFCSERYWQAYFKLTTDHRAKHYQIFDRYLWGLAEKRVMDLIEESFPPKLLSGQSEEDLKAACQNAIDDINISLRNTTTMSPFAFPRFEITTHARKDGNSVPFSASKSRGEGDRSSDEDETYLSWEIVDNALFTPHQKWDGRSIRRFSTVVNHGIVLGMLRSRYRKLE